MKLNRLLSQYDKSKPEVIPTGIISLDRMIGGLPIGDICTIGGRPAMGKTAMALTIARNVGIDNKIPTAILSLELNEREVVKRIMATEFGHKDDVMLNAKDTTSSPQMTNEQAKVLEMLAGVGFKAVQKEGLDFINKMKEAPVWVESRMSVSMNEVIAQAERLKKENNIKVLIIDSLNWINAGYSYTDKELAMLRLAEAATRLKLAILITSELTRDVETRGCAHIPTLSDLRGGFCAETYSSIVMLIYRPEYYGIEEDELGNTKDMADIIVAKNNFGPVGTVRLRLSDKSRFVDTVSSIGIEEELKSISDNIF